MHRVWPAAFALGLVGAHACAQAQRDVAQNALAAVPPSNTPASFNTRLLAFPVDVSMFAEGNPVPPGSYRLDVYLNEGWKGKHRIRFEAVNPGDRIAQPCFDAQWLETLGFDTKRIAPDKEARLASGEAMCVPLDQIIPGTRSRFDAGLQQLHLHAPQIALLRRARGYVDPKHWDAGMTAATLAYDYNAWHSKQSLQRQTSHYLGLRGGVHIGDWRLRYRGTVTRNSGQGLHYRNHAFYLEHALPDWRSTVFVGASNTRSQVFDSLRFIGAQLRSDERMQPDSRSGFVPIINGIAQTNARVRISQNGIQIFETTVPPGPFVIDDLYPGGNGDLLVTITEADGSEHRFTVTYTSLPQLLRPGMTRYSVAAGRYHDRNLHKQPLFAMASVSHGINNTATGYGGLLVGQGYQALSAGVGLNLPVGAVTLDATAARTQGISNGYGLRLAYSKFLINPLTHTNTDFTLAMLRTATRGYLEPAQAFQMRDALQRHQPVEQTEPRRNQLSVNISQSLPGAWGSFSLAGSVQDYWHRSGHEVQYSVGYGRNFGHVNLNLNATRSRNTANRRWDNQVLLSLSMPLDGKASNPVTLNTSLAYRPGGQTVQNSVSGTTTGSQPFNYSAYATLDSSGKQTLRGSGGLNLNTTTSLARVGGNFAVGAGNHRQFGMHASGGAVLFRHGIVFAPELGDTVGIVHAPNAEGVRVANTSGVTLNRKGYALVPYLQPYRENEVNLDPKGISTDVELSSTSRKVAPTDGAVVLLNFETRHGYAILTTLRRKDGSPAPFAAGVFDRAGKNLGYVAQGGQALIRVEQPQGELVVRWGSGTDQHCRFHYEIHVDMHAVQNPQPLGSAGKFRRLEAVCL